MSHKTDISLIFFRSWPDPIESHAPLLSALQKVDTSFLMIAQYRFPHAFTTFGSAVESAIKAGLLTPKRGNKWRQFGPLLDHAREKYPLFTSIDGNRTKTFRETRNDFEHFGFSPEDDARSAQLLLETGFPLLDDWLAAAFDSPLLDRNDKLGCLDWETEKHLRLSFRFCDTMLEQGRSNFTECFRALGHNLESPPKSGSGRASLG